MQHLDLYICLTCVGSAYTQACCSPETATACFGGEFVSPSESDSNDTTSARSQVAHTFVKTLHQYEPVKILDSRLCVLRFAERLLSARALGRTSSQHKLLTCYGFAVEAVYTALIQWLQLALRRLGSRCAVERGILPRLSASFTAKNSRNCPHAVTQCLRHTDCEVLPKLHAHTHSMHSTGGVREFIWKGK